MPPRRAMLAAVAPTIALTIALTIACSGEPSGPGRAHTRSPAAPAIGAATVAANPENVLAAVVTLRVSGADSAVVHFRLGDAPPAAADSATPSARVAGDSAVLPVLGLLPASGYVARVVAYGVGGVTTSDALSFTTDALPPDLPSYDADGADPTPGYVVFAAGRYGLVIDNTGRVVWYRRFGTGAGLAFMAEPTGRYVVRPPTPDPNDLEPWLEIDPAGAITRTLGCARGLQPRPHDLVSEASGAYWLLCDETRTMDLAASGGVSGARVTGTVVQHVGADGALLFEWSAFDHFQITDLDPAERTGASVNWTHGNALDLDADGNLVVSFRSLDEITKIDVRTGAVIWRLGGRRNQFIFRNTGAPAFVHQHGLRAIAPDALSLLDNLGDPAGSRAERYVLDEASRTATLAQSFAATPAAVTQIGGSVQLLPNGHTLVSFGTAGRVEEYDAAGRVTWRIAGSAGYVFRAQRIQSLYAPGVGTGR